MTTLMLHFLFLKEEKSCSSHWFHYCCQTVDSDSKEHQQASHADTCGAGGASL